MKLLPRLLPLLLFLPLCTCGPAPRKTIRLGPELRENSGLIIAGDQFIWHNDSGDGPYLYRTDATGKLLRTDTLSAPASDYEDLTRDPAGNLYVGDFGNNRGTRTSHAIYRYDTAGRTAAIHFTYPDQAGAGILEPGDYNCEAMVYYRDSLHLFTKNELGGRGNFYTYHYRLPARPGTHVADLVDSLYLPRRVVTAGALDSVRGELVLTAYNFRMLLGIFPSGAASLITITDFPAGRFLRGRVHRRNLAWGWPTQFEAVDFYDEKWLYVAAEATAVRRHGVAKRKRRRHRSQSRDPRR